MFEYGVESAFRGLGMSSPGLLRPKELVRSLQTVARAKGYAAWAEYATAAEIHRQLARPTEKKDLRQLDGWAQCSARVAACMNLTPGSADGVLRRGLALRDRLPMVNDALKSGRLAPHHIPDIVSRTELVDGMPWSLAVDAEIAEMFWRDGSWSIDRMRNMVDQILYRHDPAGVRERRERAKDGRSFKRYPGQDGMADIVASMTAQNALLLDNHVQKLASKVCPNDPRTKPQRLSDAMFCATMGVGFACECGNEECELTFKETNGTDDGPAQFVVHVVMDQATAEGRASNPGFIDGHGVISGDHAQDIAGRSDARIRPMGGTFEERPTGNRPTCRDDASTNDNSEQDERGKGYEVLFPKRDPEMSPEKRLAEWKRFGKFDERMAAAEPRGAQTSSAKDSHAEMATPETPEEFTERETTATEEPDPPSIPEPAPTKKVIAGCDAPPERPDPYRQCATTGSERVGNRKSRRSRNSKLLPMSLPSDRYRPSTALDSFVRIRDAYCIFPGCSRPAWRTDVDHTDEYNHDDPVSGGQTRPGETKCLCRFHHLLKSFGDWVDFQDIDADGRSRAYFVSPEGVVFSGPVWTGEDLFPDLVDMQWQDDPPPRSTVLTEPMRRRTRLANKHARRQSERERNRQAIENPEPPSAAGPTENDGPSPPF